MYKFFIITYYIQGQFYKQATRKDDYDWDWLKDTENEIIKQFPDYKSIRNALGGREGYNVLFNEEINAAVCFSYKMTEITGLLDANKNVITVGDTLVLKSIADTGDEEKIKDYLVKIYCSGWNDGEYYLRSMYHTENHYKYDDDGHFIGTISAKPDIRNVNQEMMNDYIIYEDKH